MARKAPPSADVDINMTPMIDCTFQLILFFILASQAANEALAKKVQIVRPEQSQAISAAVAEFPNRVTVKVGAAAGETDSEDPMLAAKAGFYKIGAEKYDVSEWDRLIEVLRQKRREYLKGIGMNEDEAARAAAAAEQSGSKDNPAIFWLEIRADKRVNYADIAPVIRAGVEAGISKVNITALTAPV